jgi:hypothetical protein
VKTSDKNKEKQEINMELIVEYKKNPRQTIIQTDEEKIKVISILLQKKYINR